MSVTSHSHPKGLYVLFFSEAWERFSYYGMRALLVLYLVNHLHYQRESALEIYALYTGLVYFTPIIGGYLADKYLGARKAVIIGASVMALGHLAMAFESLLNLALGLLIVGNGFFKPNISTIVGGLYEENDPRRDGGFTIFYMGINLGAFFSPLVCGTLGETIGWHYGFSAAGIGMVCGLFTFITFQHLLGPAGFPPGFNHEVDRSLRPRDWRDIIVYVIASVAFVAGFLKFWAFFGPIWSQMTILNKLGAGVIVIALIETLRRVFSPKSQKSEAPLTLDEWQRIAVICILSIFVICFWIGFEQAGGTMTLFADQQTDRHFMGWEIPASYFQSINPMAIMLLAPIFSMMWIKVDESKYKMSTPTKMAIGMIMLGIGFIIMYIGQNLAVSRNHDEMLPVLYSNGLNLFSFEHKFNVMGMVGPFWLAAVYLVHTLGELCLSPIGLSMVTKLSPARLTSLMMGVWLISSALSNYLAGRLEEIMLHFNIPLYGFLIAISVGSGIILLLITPILKKWMHGRA
ncbi:MAG: peptide MFS transporter [Candidatus Wallbacteria bacterium]